MLSFNGRGGVLILLCVFIFSGAGLGSNFRVNDDVGGANQFFPTIATDGSGNFIITWEDWRNGDRDIYTQRYNSSGTAVGSNFRVNDDVGAANQWYPAIAADGSGNFIITWKDQRTNFRDDIYARRYDSSGTALDSSFLVNDTVVTGYQDIPPAIATDGSGNFIITWNDIRNGDWDIYAQRYNSSGLAVDSNFKVNDDVGTLFQQRPAIAADGSGNFIITWFDQRNTLNIYGDIYAQRYNSSGTAVGSNFKVNDDVGNDNQDRPDIATDGSGNFIITWQDARNYFLDIYAQRYNASGVALDTNFKVNDDVGNANQSKPTIATDGSGNFIITWFDTRNVNDDIYAQRYNSSGLAVGSNFRVNDENGAATHFWPDVAIGSGNFIITWNDNRNGNYDIYADFSPTKPIYIQAFSPVDLVVTDPNGDSIGVSFNTIPGATYGTPNDSIFIPVAIPGNYRIRVVKDTSDVSGDSTYSLNARIDGTADQVLASDQPVPDMGESHSYVITSDPDLPACLSKPGDANASGTYTLSDVIAIVNYIFNKPGCSPQPLCWISSLLCRGNWNGDALVTLSDVIRAVNYIFNKPGGPWNAQAVGVCCLP